MRKESEGRFVWDEGEFIITPPDKKKDGKKAKDFKEVMNGKKGVKKNEKEN